jgi:hypothetical protein
MADRWSLSLGALSAPIEEQLKNQGLCIALPPRKRHCLQQDADQISQLYIRGLLTEAEARRAQKRLLKEICKHLEPISKENQP